MWTLLVTKRRCHYRSNVSGHVYSLSQINSNTGRSELDAADDTNPVQVVINKLYSRLDSLTVGPRYQVNDHVWTLTGVSLRVSTAPSVSAHVNTVGHWFQNSCYGADMIVRFRRKFGNDPAEKSLFRFVKKMIFSNFLKLWQFPTRSPFLFYSLHFY